MGNKIYTPKLDFIADDGTGAPAVMSKGQTRVREGHPLLQRYPDEFEEMKVQYELPDEETATASTSRTGGRKRGRPEKSERQLAREKVADEVKGADPHALDNPDPPSGDGPTGNDGPIWEDKVGEGK